MTLTENADESTFIHEMGHHYYNVLKQAAKIAGKNSQAAKDVETIDNWANYKKGMAAEYEDTASEKEFSDLEKEILSAEEKGDTKKADELKARWGQERWARGVEEYFNEGIAPTAKLRKIFDNFKKWLKEIYRGLRGAGAKPSDDVRAVMERMIASDKEILSGKASRLTGDTKAAYDKALADLKAAGAKNAEANAYIAAKIAERLSSAYKEVGEDRSAVSLLPEIQAQDDTNVKNFIAYHNISEENLEQAMKLGGFPVPSIAITKNNIPFEGYGRITFIGNSEMIDPAKKGNDVYSRDAWTVTFPEVVYDRVKVKDADAFIDKIHPAFSKTDDKSFSDIASRLRNNRNRDNLQSDLMRSNGMKYYFATKVLGKDIKIPIRTLGSNDEFLLNYKVVRDALKEIGWDFNTEKSAKEKFTKLVRPFIDKEIERASKHMPEAKEIYNEVYFDEDDNFNSNIYDSLYSQARNYGKKEVDTRALDEVLNKAIGKANYEKFVNDELDKVYKNPQIMVGKKKMPITLENIVLAMAKEKGAAKENSFTFSDRKLLASMSKRYKNLDEMRKDKNNLLPTEKAELSAELFKNAMDDYRATINDHYYRNDNTFEKLDEANIALAEAAKYGGSRAAIKSALERHNFTDIDDRIIDAAQNALKAAKEVKTDYFEAKPLRPITFDEFSAVVLPKDTKKEIKDYLKAQGLTVKEYDSNKEGDRQRAINEVQIENPDVLFQKSAKSPIDNNGKMKDNTINDYLTIKANGSFAVKLLNEKPPLRTESEKERIHRRKEEVSNMDRLLNVKENPDAYAELLSDHTVEQIKKEVERIGSWEKATKIFNTRYNKVLSNYSEIHSEENVIGGLLNLKGVVRYAEQQGNIAGRNRRLARHLANNRGNVQQMGRSSDGASEKLNTETAKHSNTSAFSITEKPSKVNGKESTFFSVDSDLMDVSGHIPQGGIPFIDNLWYNEKYASDPTDISTISPNVLRKGNATKHISSVINYLKDKGHNTFQVKTMSEYSNALMKSLERKGYIKAKSAWKYEGDNVTYDILNIAEEKHFNQGAFSIAKKGGKFTAKLNAIPKGKEKQLANIAGLHHGKLSGDTFTFENEGERVEFIRKAEAFLSTADEDTKLKFSVDAWHGNGLYELIDKFSLKYLGTGEGAQIHGWGLYFAKSREVGEGYREQLSKYKEDVIVNGKLYISDSDKIPARSPEKQAAITLADFDYDVEKAINHLKNGLAYAEKNGVKNTIKQSIEMLQSGYVKPAGVGHLYHVQIPDEDVMLDEQEFGDGQSNYVKQAISKMADELEDMAYKYRKTGEGRKISWRILAKLAKPENYDGRNIYNILSEALGGDKEASLYLSKHGIKGIKYWGQQDGRCYVVFDDNAVDIIEKFSAEKLKENAIAKLASKADIVKMEDLTAEEKRFMEMGEKLGTPVVWVSADPRLNGWHKDGVTFINRNRRMTGEQTFWHEALHFILQNEDGLLSELVDTVGITDKQIEAWKNKTGRFELSREEVVEEMLCDAFYDPASRVKVFQEIAGKNPSLMEKIMAWINRLKEEFFDAFRGVQGKLTQSQKNNMTRVIDNHFKNLKGKDGKPLFKRKGKEWVFADGRSLENAIAASGQGENRAKSPIENSDNVGDNENNGRLSDMQKTAMYADIERAIDNHIKAQVKSGAKLDDILAELTSEHSAHRQDLFHRVRSQIQDLKAHLKDDDVKRRRISTVGRKDPSNWSKEMVDTVYNQMISELEGVLDYGGVLYREIALDRRGNKGMGGAVVSWQSAEVQRAKREGVKSSSQPNTTNTKHSAN